MCCPGSPHPEPVSQRRDADWRRLGQGWCSLARAWPRRRPEFRVDIVIVVYLGGVFPGCGGEDSSHVLPETSLEGARGTAHPVPGSQIPRRWTVLWPRRPAVTEPPQSTISRALTALTPMLGRVLADYVPVAEDLDSRTQYVVDGTLLPCWSWHGQRQLYSGKHTAPRRRPVVYPTQSGGIGGMFLGLMPNLAPKG